MNFEVFLRKLFRNYQQADQHLHIYQDFKQSGAVFRYTFLGEISAASMISKGDQYQISEDIAADLNLAQVQGFVPVGDMINFANRMILLESSLSNMPTVQIYSSKYANIILHALSSANRTLELHYDCLEKENIELLKHCLQYVKKLSLRCKRVAKLGYQPPVSDFYHQLLCTPLVSLELNDMYLSEEHQMHIRDLLKLKLVDVALVNVQLDDMWNQVDLSSKKVPLQKLHLSNVNIPKILMRQMLLYSNMTELKLHGISVSSVYFPIIENLQVLEWNSMNLEDFNQDMFVELLNRNPRLSLLSFTFNMFTRQNINDFKNVLQNHLYLENLSIEYDPSFDFESIGKNTSIKYLSLLGPNFIFPEALLENHFITDMQVNGVSDTTISQRNRAEFAKNLADLFVASKTLGLLALPSELKMDILRKLCLASYIPRLYIELLTDCLLTQTYSVKLPFNINTLINK
ncbi:hypothetical protein HDV01_003185 [Terramyces sp. JEL0728]|nr:hypothetical protein HDV01_003185 [Terramyces sp. JEL0728]